MSTSSTDGKNETSSVDDDKKVFQSQVLSHAVDAARAATEAERELSIPDAFRVWKKAVFWSFFLSTALIMEAYDTNLLGNFYSYPAFNAKFGTFVAKTGKYSLSAKWQTILSNAGASGQILGLVLNGFISERFGYRWTMMASMFMMNAVLFIPFFAPNVQVLVVGQVLQGIPWGIFQTLTTSYASEICPIALRPFLTTWVNSCWAMGKLLAAGILRGFISNTSQWGYKIPMALQWIWPFPILVGCYFCPESPWWLVRHGRVEEARRVIKRITNEGSSVVYNSEHRENYLSMIIHTNALERSMTQGTSYLQLFQGDNLRRTIVACVVWMSQNTCGNVVGASASFFLTSAGMATTSAYSFNVGIQALGFVGTFGGWFFMPYFGRRTIWLYGLLGMECLLLIIGGLGFASQHAGAAWAIGALVVLLVVVFDVTIGPICYCLVSEMSSTRLRTKTIALARIMYNIVGIVNNVINPRVINATAWNLGAKSALYWAGVNGAAIVVHFFILPETKDRTYGELDVLFEQKVKARDFSKTSVDQFSDSGKHSAAANEELAQTEANSAENPNYALRHV